MIMSGPADNCPVCVTPERAVTARPLRVAPAPGGCRADYECRACGHWWQTSWLLPAAEMAAYEEGEVAC